MDGSGAGTRTPIAALTGQRPAVERHRIRCRASPPCRPWRGQPPPWQGEALPAELHPHGLEPPQPGSRPDGLPISRFPMESPPCADPGLPPYNGGVAAVRGGEVPSVRFERTLASPSDWCLCRWATRASEPSPGADPGLLPYEGKVTAVCDGEAHRRGLEPRHPAPRAGALTLTRHPACGRGRPATADAGLRRLSVETVGIEPLHSCRPHSPAAWSRRDCHGIPLCRCQCSSRCARRRCSQGREDSNPRRAVLEAAVLAAELRPYEIRNRPELIRAFQGS